MKIKIGTNWKKIWIHFLLMISSSVLIILLFFYGFLPWFTDHGHVIIVPDLKGMNESEVKEITEELALRYEILDSAYSEKDEPNTIISQNPVANFEVKENRTIYVTINTSEPPKITFTEDNLAMIISKDITSAKITLEGLGLKVGTPTYIDGEYKDLVINLMVNNQKVIEGATFYKGTVATLIVSNGKSSATDSTSTDTNLVIPSQSPEVF